MRAPTRVGVRRAPGPAGVAWHPSRLGQRRAASLRCHASDALMRGGAASGSGWVLAERVSVMPGYRAGQPESCQWSLCRLFCAESADIPGRWSGAIRLVHCPLPRVAAAYHWYVYGHPVRMVRMPGPTPILGPVVNAAREAEAAASPRRVPVAPDGPLAPLVVMLTATLWIALRVSFRFSSADPLLGKVTGASACVRGSRARAACRSRAGVARLVWQ
jgi:hypothetical protein